MCGTPLAFHVSAFSSLRKGQNLRLASLLVTSSDVAHDFCHRDFCTILGPIRSFSYTKKVLEARRWKAPEAQAEAKTE